MLKFQNLQYFFFPYDAAHLRILMYHCFIFCLLNNILCFEQIRVHSAQPWQNDVQGHRTYNDNEQS